MKQFSEKKITAVIILNYNNYEDTVNCIESVERFNTTPVKYIVVDNGSTRKDAVKALDSYLGKKFIGQYKYGKEDEFSGELGYMSFIVSATNDGYAKGNNKGIKLAMQDEDIDYILILNNDIVFYEDIIGRLVDFYEKHTDVGVVCPLLYTKGKKGIDYTCARKQVGVFDLGLLYILMCENILGYYEHYNEKQKILLNHHELLDEEEIPIEMPSGSCFLISKSVFKEIGYFDKGTFLYYEENILQKKLERIHKRNFLLPDIGCIHLGAATTLKTKSNAFLIKCEIKSAKRFVMKYCNPSIFAKILFLMGYCMMSLKIKLLQYRQKI